MYHVTFWAACCFSRLRAGKFWNDPVSYTRVVEAVNNSDFTNSAHFSYTCCHTYRSTHITDAERKPLLSFQLSSDCFSLKAAKTHVTAQLLSINWS